MTEEENSQGNCDDLIRQGLADYETLYEDWALELMIDHIVILSELKNQIIALIKDMKQDLLDNYTERKE